ncbi:hypothetical protein [Burkholderia gladioli]|uniref:hypothetical protein n=1 Tax=Burkholderia gladioli TaxID=28095 RepID=UPI000628B0E3|nr:hypothetical protein [Burkholderia gladioli]KKJ06054.1 hypothetical protein XF14_13745 [Burkholderia gladioli]
MISVDYEVVCQTIGQLIARQAELIAEEESRAEPDQESLAEATAARAALVVERDTLMPDDALGVMRVLTTYGPIASQLNGQNRRNR